MKHIAPGLTAHELKHMLGTKSPVTDMIYSANAKARTNGMREAFVVNRADDESTLTISDGVTPGRIERFVMKLDKGELTTKASALIRENTVLAIHGHPVHRDVDVARALQPTYTDMAWLADDAANFNPNVVHGIVVPEGSYINNRLGMHLVLYGLDRVVNRRAQAHGIARRMKGEARRVGGGENIDPSFYKDLGVRTVQLACGAEGTLRMDSLAALQKFDALRIPPVGLPSIPMLAYQK